MAWLVYFIIGYMALGLFIFEWAWKKTKPMRIPNEERDSKYPAFRRLDKKWNKIKYYPGALLWLPFKIVLILSVMVKAIIFTKILCLGHNF